ncbi:MAG: phosphate acyltransferase, partial [Alphaproteobacteria bacterium]|nr:phosphate acyltransferase [Alphaproteobacteria bacterium]
GLLIGAPEEGKGGAALRDAAARLRAVSKPGFDFKGFIEGDDITGGAVDVVVTDGFTGNVALKALEGSARLYGAALRRAAKSSLAGMAGFWLARRTFGKVRDRLDPRRYNGAVFVGLNGIVVKAHGSSDAFAFANAIGFAVDMSRHGFLEDVRAAFERTAPPVAATAS